ncbi:MAG: hypothetical protein M3Y57_13415 [Acidobacteriota bacterium]|nr:hypothetical protein [Acidobacteriota bacterium]
MQKTPPRKPGPNTIAGKINSSKNSTKHSLRSNPDKLLPGETQQDYDAAWDIWAAEYDSASPATARLLKFIVNDDRLLSFSVTAVIEAQIALVNAEAASEPNPALIELLHKDLQHKLRYKTNFERSFQRSLRNIEQFGHRRVLEAQAAERLEIFENKAACLVAVTFHKNGLDHKTVLPLSTKHVPESEKTPPS